MEIDFPVARHLPSRAVSFFCRLAAVGLIAAAGLFPAAHAGDLSKADIERRFEPPLHVQDKLSQIPAWPLTSELEPDAGPVGYVFESIDLAPVPGFEGTPMNFLVSIDRKGNFMNVELLRQHEPVFLGGLGEAPLREFITQYAGRNIKQQFLIALNAARNRTGPADTRSSQTTLDGVSKATASVRIVNQTVLGAALEVARAKLGFADRSKHGPAAQVRADIDDPVAFDEMLKNGMVGRLRLTNAEVEKLFVGTDGAEVDEEGLAQPEAVFTDIYIAYLNTPSIGRAILGDAQYQEAMARNFENRHLWWIGSAGRYPIVDDNFVPGGQSSRLSMAQDGLFLELRDQGFEPKDITGPPPLNTSLLFGVYAEAGLDPGRPLDLTLTITRAKGMILPSLTHKTVTLKYAPPGRLFIYPPEPLPEWVLAWQQRWLDLSILSAALIVLSIALARPRWISVDARRLKIFRLGFLAFTLLYIGWYVQGQLSIVQVTGALKSLKSGQGLSSFLYDPISLLLIAFTLVSFVIWGRGTFCGWLCPFGALQEFVGLLGRKLRLPRLHIPLAVAKRLEWGRYIALAVLVGAAVFVPRQGESLNELEPFKTAITVGFDRSWPFVAYAVALLVAGAFYYKFFCRFICPLGAVMSLGGRLRRFDWLTRRIECGKPCQSCKAKCAYDAIEPAGEIRYDACFQCLDCVGIYHDARRCPVLLYEKKGLVLTPKGVMVAGSAD
ncbi:MAG: 4Fe-4S binding protein [Betaproteobacteria bacterium HGW-Betaproteobacteria-6]|jgi:transcriptional regulator of nitric oxide reductase|nr:MAG: 4Fe-4S binding protein [Betaproteobacteria bacterium HGW-Betaproteobacteria-6]